MIDPRAIVDPEARLGANIKIGAWAVIGQGVVIGEGSVIGSHVVVQAGTRIEPWCRIGPHAVLGAHPLAPARLSELDEVPGTEADRAATAAVEPLVLGTGCTVVALSRVVRPVAAGDTVAGDPAESVAPAL